MSPQSLGGSPGTLPLARPLWACWELSTRGYSEKSRGQLQTQIRSGCKFVCMADIQCTRTLHVQTRVCTTAHLAAVETGDVPTEYACVNVHLSVTPQEPPSAHSPRHGPRWALGTGHWKCTAPAYGRRVRRSARERRRLSRWTDCPRGQCREASISQEEMRPVGPGGALLGALGQDGRRAADGDGLGLQHSPSACWDLRSSRQWGGPAGFFRLPGQGRLRVWGVP